jgi:selenium-binding protein 1
MSAHPHDDHEHGAPGYASPEVARQQPPEQFVYVASLYEGTGIDRPDFIAVVDVDPESSTYEQIVHRTEMPNVGDELHHFGWNACSSACHSQLQRDTMIVPGVRSSRIHIIDISEPRAPRIKDVIEGEEIKEKLGLSAPHTVHCMPGDIVTISMLGDADGNTPGGFAVLDARDFSIAERWERDAGGIEFMYDFWYQPRQNALVTSEWGAPNTFLHGFNPADVVAGKYGRRLHFWDLERRAKVQTIDLGDHGLIPLEIRWQHNPDSAEGFVGATLSSNIIHFHRDNGSWAVNKVIDVGNEELEGWPLEGGVPSLITDLVLSLDDKDLFFSNWLHGDVRHYDVSDPSNPQLKSRIWLGGLLGRDGGHLKARGALHGGPQMIQNSLDGDRVYVTNSLFSTWDNQFYPEIEGWLVKLERQPDGTFGLDPSFFVDFHEQADGARPHEIHLPGGDCTTEIFQ